MREIRRKFNAYFNAGNHSMKIEQFATFEMALMVVARIKPDADPAKGYIVFTKYQSMGRRRFTPDFYLVQNASICLRKYRSEKAWKDTLKEYEKAEYDGIRLFEVTSQAIQRKDIGNLVYPDREEDYMQYISSYNSTKKGRYATKGTYRYYNGNNEENVVYVELNESMEEKIEDARENAVQREGITLEIAQLIAAAREIQEKIPEDPCAKVLQNNFIKEVNRYAVKSAHKIELNQVTNIVGMVGAGKTTLLKTIAYSLNKLDKRVVIVTDTVAEVFNLYQYFRALGCDCSPLVGKAERVKYINQIMDGEAYYLEEELSRYLTPGCLIDGLDIGNANAVSFGEEPCTKLSRGGKKYVCPYFDRCNATLMQRMAVQSRMVITTVAGLVMGRVGKLQDIFLREVMESVDVVFYDECDRVQKNLDDLFTPATEFNEFIKEGEEGYIEFIRETNAKRMENMADMYYMELRSKSPTVLACVSNAVRATRGYGSKRALSDTFSAYTLLDSIREEISEDTRKKLYRLMEYRNTELSALYNIMMASCESVRTDRFDMLLAAWIDEKEPQLALEDVSDLSERYPNKTEKERRKLQKEMEKENRRRIILRKKIALIITLIYFDKFVMDIGDAYEDTQDITLGYNELVGFIRTRFTAQQDYLPSALMGNLFGIKSATDDDILLFRQYAYGRSLLTDMPYLRIDEEGRALGPHVVLLSGSSYARGSYEYHVNAPVNYIVEADSSVREFIARTRFVELGLEERISGSPLEEREDILRKVVDKCTPNILSELKKEGKILLVVNSFAQAELVAEHLRGNLNKRGCKEEVCAMISDRNLEKSDINRYIRRGEVYKFHRKKARILVAPALAIERGHNIVDESGHSSLSSVFFLIRPMGVPDDVKEKSIKMNGYMAEKMYQCNNSDIYENNLYVRREATRFWNRMNDSSRKRLDNVTDTGIKTDLVATMFVLILQIFGRLCRVSDENKEPPVVYFVDGAFRKREGTEDGFDTLNEIHKYLKEMFSDSESGQVARTLYEPFLAAYEKGIKFKESVLIND